MQSRKGSPQLALLPMLSRYLEEFILQFPPARLSRAFYERPDALLVAKELLHCLIWTQTDDQPPVTTAGQLSEVEAYVAPDDPASHAYNGKITPRTQSMYSCGGTAYVYCCYGIHTLINITTNVEGIPHAVLLRAMTPVVGLSCMQQRRRQDTKNATLNGFWRLGQGPACLAQALGIKMTDNGKDLVLGDHLWLTEGVSVPRFITYLRDRTDICKELQDTETVTSLLSTYYAMCAPNMVRIQKTIRLGLGSVSEYARNLEYRFCVSGERSVSRFPVNPPKVPVLSVPQLAATNPSRRAIASGNHLTESSSVPVRITQSVPAKRLPRTRISKKPEHKKARKTRSVRLASLSSC